MASFDDVIQKAVDDGEIPGVVLLARDRSGKFSYAKALGRSSLEPGHEKAMQPDSVLRLASSSKLLTTVAVLQAVERGLLGLDDDVGAHVPVLARQEVLTGFTWYGRPLTRPRRRPITLRALLTQTAGTGYDFLKIQPIWRWRWWHGQPIGQGGGCGDRLAFPLLHEPGEGWTYGSGISWAGKALERVSGVTLEEWIRKNICEPLGLTSITFFPGRDPAVAARLAAVSARDPRTGRPAYSAEANQPETESDCMGGEGLYASLEDFLAVLHSLLTDDGRLLRPETAAALMFSPQLRGGASSAGGDEAEAAAQRAALDACLQLPVWICTTILKKGEYDWGCGGVLIDGDSHPCLRRGSLMWSGLFHVLWWIDRETGVCAVFGTQLLPATDKVAVPLIGRFMEHVYELYGRQKPNGGRPRARANGHANGHANGSAKGDEEKRGYVVGNGRPAGPAEAPAAQVMKTESVPAPVGGLAAWASSFWRGKE